MLNERLKKSLTNAGFVTLPTDRHTPLHHYGLDSLTLALLIVELEREFKIKIPVIPLDKERFTSLHTMEQYLRELGVL